MYLYILLNNTLYKYYIGITSDLARRISEHNGSNSHYTGKNDGVWKIIYTKEYSDKSIAHKEEIRLKKAKNKKYLEWYIKQSSPDPVGNG